MKLLTSTIAGDVVGSIAGVTFKRTAAGAVAQAKRTGPPRRTTATTLRHSYLAKLNATWHSFTPTQRAAWNLIYLSLIASGYDKAPRRFQSAEALFISHNLPRLIFGLATQTTPPTLATTNAPFKQIAALSYLAHFYIDFTQDPVLTGEYCFIEWTPRVPASTNARKASFAHRVLITGPRSATYYCVTAETNPPRTARWIQLRRHSSSRLTSPAFPQLLFPI